jgi:hypothetical protein
MIGYFQAFEDSCNRFPGFSHDVQGVYQVQEKGRIRFYTNVVQEQPTLGQPCWGLGYWPKVQLRWKRQPSDWNALI